MRLILWTMMALHKDDAGLVPIYVRLLEEGTDCSRPTQAERIGNDLFKLLPTHDYDPDHEHWEFPPGSVVRAVAMADAVKEYLLAVKP